MPPAPSHPYSRSRVLPLVVLLSLSLLIVCCRGGGPGCFSSFDGRAGQAARVILASTTSTDDTGLFQVLIPAFEEAHPEYRVSVIAVGSGQALALGRSGDADALLVHAPREEERFMKEGHGDVRREVMYNDFVIAGPPSDPAGISGMEDAKEALRAIAGSEGRLVSRGDGSGTHLKEQELLESSGLDGSSDWIDSIGQGMGETLTMASQRQAYVLSDRGTFLSMRQRLDLRVQVEGDESLFNPYGAILTHKARNPKGARALVDWLVSPAAKDIIREFGVSEYGEPLFVPLGD